MNKIITLLFVFICTVKLFAVEITPEQWDQLKNLLPSKSIRIKDGHRYSDIPEFINAVLQEAAKEENLESLTNNLNERSVVWRSRFQRWSKDNYWIKLQKAFSSMSNADDPKDREILQLISKVVVITTLDGEDLYPLSEEQEEKLLHIMDNINDNPLPNRENDLIFIKAVLYKMQSPEQGWPQRLENYKFKNIYSRFKNWKQKNMWHEVYNGFQQVMDADSEKDKEILLLLEQAKNS